MPAMAAAALAESAMASTTVAGPLLESPTAYGLVLFALLMWNTTAMTGAVLQMLSHGLMTALFFALIGMIYGRTHTRDIREMGGLMKIMPFLSTCYVIAGFASLGLPGLSGFVAEMTVFVGGYFP